MTDDFEIIKQLPNGWRLSPAYFDSKETEYVRWMAKELLAMPRNAPNVPTHFNGKLIKDLSPEERDAFLFSMQPDSTKSAMEAQKQRHPSEDIDHLLRSMPECLANPSAKNREELVGTRPVAPDEIAFFERERRKGGFKLGESKESSVPPEKRDRGVQAFTYSKSYIPTDQELKKLIKGKPMDNAVVQPEKGAIQKKKKLTLRQRLHRWFFKDSAYKNWTDDADTH